MIISCALHSPSAKIAKPASAINTSGPLTNQRKDRIMAKADFTAQMLRELLHYNPETGVFTWIIQRRGSRAAPIGAVAGGLDALGYLQVSFKPRTYRCHRLAWLYMTGDWPKHDIDHKDGNRTNNAFINLRDVPRSVNLQNIRMAKSQSKSGILGVHKKGTRWVSSVQLDGQQNRASHATPEAAQAAYIARKRALHPGNTL